MSLTSIVFLSLSTVIAWPQILSKGGKSGALGTKRRPASGGRLVSERSGWCRTSDARALAAARDHWAGSSQTSLWWM